MMIRARTANDVHVGEVSLVDLLVDFFVRPLVCESGVLEEDGVLVEVEVDGLGKKRRESARG